MRLATRLLASASTTVPAPSAAAAGLTKPMLALLPPVPLYRRLLRAHRRHLPPDMRVLGDEYIKAEFRAHRNVENPVHLVCFVFSPLLPISLFSSFFSDLVILSLLPLEGRREGGRVRESVCESEIDAWVVLPFFVLGHGLGRSGELDCNNTTTTGRLPHRVAALRPEDRGRRLEGREAGQVQD